MSGGSIDNKLLFSIDNGHKLDMGGRTMKAFREDDETIPSQKKHPKYRSPLRPKTIQHSVTIRNLFVSSAKVEGNTTEKKGNTK